MKRKYLKCENTDFLAHFSSKVWYVTHEVGVAGKAPNNCIVRIGNIYDWKECSNNLLHNNSTMKVSMG